MKLHISSLLCNWYFDYNAKSGTPVYWTSVSLRKVAYKFLSHWFWYLILYNVQMWAFILSCCCDIVWYSGSYQVQYQSRCTRGCPWRRCWILRNEQWRSSRKLSDSWYCVTSPHFKNWWCTAFYWFLLFAPALSQPFLWFIWYLFIKISRLWWLDVVNLSVTDRWKLFDMFPSEYRYPKMYVCVN